MKAWRDLGKVLIVAAVFAVCFDLLAEVIGPGSPWLGLLLMFYFMALANLAEPLFAVRMPRALRPVNPLNSAYRWFGVHAFGALLRNTPLRYLNGSVYLADGRRSVAKLSRRVESSEAIHFWAAIGFTPYIAYTLSRALYLEAVVFLMVQLVVNIYPILHLRLVRARLDRISRNGIPLA
ncbi:hypothetical protein RugamoR57_29540 [Duganella caerulea]|uniref:glycosyl-4,4'-diaponeurosporenoate acyltransferase CrtO family protein n=1 Tax=Duganella caerulea TaxID=2885762 RepID=UPI0030E90FF4